MKQKWKKAAALLMAASIAASGSAVAALASDKTASSFLQAPLAAASNSQPFRVGDFIEVGQSISFNNVTYLVTNDSTHETRKYPENTSLTVTSLSYDRTTGQYGFEDNYSGEPILLISHEPFETEPTGFYVTGGTGTAENPYTFGMTLTLTLPEDGGVTAFYAFGGGEVDPANVKPYGQGDYGYRDNTICYTSDKPFIVENTAEQLYIAHYDSGNQNYSFLGNLSGNIKVSYIKGGVIPVHTASAFRRVLSSVSTSTWNNDPLGFSPTICLTQNINLSDFGDFTVNDSSVYGDLTIDLNGHTLDMRSRASETDSSLINSPFSVYSGTLTLTDQSAAGTGKITGVSSFNARKYSDLETGTETSSALLIDSGIYRLLSSDALYAEEGCSISINGGTFSNWFEEWNAYLLPDLQSAVRNENNTYTVTPSVIGAGTYKQTADKDGKHYIRYIFIVPASELENKTEAVFTANYNGTEKTFPSNTYYTGMSYNGRQYTPAADHVIFAVTITGVPAENESKLTCSMQLKDKEVEA